MLNIRYRNQTNAWPGFVDLFSNLVIILIFLMIVFVFLWTTTSVFNKSTGMRVVAELKETNAAQAEQIQQMTMDEQEAKRLLIMARDELTILEQDNAVLSSNNAALNDELTQADLSLEDLITAYENKISETEIQAAELEKTVQELTEQLNVAIKNADKTDEITAALEQERATMQSKYDALTAQISQLQSALDAAEEKSRAQEVEYVEMSTRLNKALADKVAELNEVSQYQSAFYRAVKIAMGDRTSIQPDGDRFIVSSDILFPSGGYKIGPKGKEQLRLIANVIKDMENQIPTDINWIIRVDGHTDNKAVIAGTRAYKNNMQLSFLRATAVADELEKNGVSRRRLLPSGFGDTAPVALGDDAASLQQNRRIELQLTNK